jgi:hypothetical protein
VLRDLIYNLGETELREFYTSNIKKYHSLSRDSKVQNVGKLLNKSF